MSVTCHITGNNGGTRRRDKAELVPKAEVPSGDPPPGATAALQNSTPKAKRKGWRCTDLRLATPTLTCSLLSLLQTPALRPSPVVLRTTLWDRYDCPLLADGDGEAQGSRRLFPLLHVALLRDAGAAGAGVEFMPLSPLLQEQRFELAGRSGFFPISRPHFSRQSRATAATQANWELGGRHLGEDTNG